MAAPTIERTLDRLYAFAWETRARGAPPRSELLERETMPASAALARRLGTRPGAPIQRFFLLRTADGEPLLVETIFLPLELARGVEHHLLEQESLYDLLEQVHGVRATHARETIRPVVLESRVAGLLRARSGTAAFLVERVTWAHERPIELRQSLVRGDRYLYSVHLPRQQLGT